MKLTVVKPVEIEAVVIRVDLPIRRGVDQVPADFPFRTGDRWAVNIDLDTGRVRGWRSELAVRVDMKVCDEGVYTLFDADGNPLAVRRDYVPACVPGRYGDDVDLEIGADGLIANWSQHCTPDAIRESFFPQAL